MDAPTPAPAPDPAATAAAQTASNKATAVSQYGLNATNQVTPYGNLTYSQNGAWDDGTPRFTATQTLSPQQQSLFDLGNQTQQNLGQIGVNQSAKIGQQLDTPFSIDAARGNKLADINRTFLDPQWQRNDEDTRTRLINSGVRPGSEAYTRAMQEEGDAKSRAYNSMFLDSYGKANDAALTERNQPINEITALLRGSGVQQPSFTNTPSPGVAPTDVIGATGQSLQQSNVGYNADMAQRQAMMSGLFGLGGAGVKAAALGGWG